MAPAAGDCAKVVGMDFGSTSVRTRRRRDRAVVVLVLAVIGCGLAMMGVLRGNRPDTSRPPSTNSHVVVIVMENKEQTDVLGNAAAPYLNGLARRYGLATQSLRDHPPVAAELPRADERLDAWHHLGLHELQRRCPEHRRSAQQTRASPGRPTSRSACAVLQGCNRRPLREAAQPVHVLHGRRAEPGALQPSRRLRRAERRPAMRDDCRRTRGSRRMSATTPMTAVSRRATASSLAPCRRCCASSARTGSSFSPGTKARATRAAAAASPAGGHVATIVAGPDVIPGARESSPVDHYGVLATIERTLGLPLLGAAADARNGRLDPLFRRPPRIR